MKIHFYALSLATEFFLFHILTSLSSHMHKLVFCNSYEQINCLKKKYIYFNYYFCFLPMALVLNNPFFKDWIFNLFKQETLCYIHKTKCMIPLTLHKYLCIFQNILQRKRTMKTKLMMGLQQNTEGNSQNERTFSLHPSYSLEIPPRDAHPAAFP